MKAFILSLIFSLSFANVSFSQVQKLGYQKIARVQEQSISLLGRGIQDKETGERLAIGCLNSDCSQFRFVYFYNQNAALWIGYPYQIQFEEGTKDHSKKDMRKFLKQVKHESKNQNALGETLTFGTALGGSIVLGVATGGSIYAIYGVVATIGLAGAQSSNHPFNMFASFSGRDIINAIDDNGWNWSSQPDRVSSKKFNRTLSHLDSDLKPDGPKELTLYRHGLVGAEKIEKYFDYRSN